MVDVLARGTCSAINPRGFKDRINVPQKYLVADTKLRKIDVQLERLLEDLEEAHRIYEQKLFDDALMLFGEAGVKMYEDRAPILLKHTGEPPQPIAPVKAAIAGNKFVLGLTDAMPEWAKPFFEPKKREVEVFPDAEEYADLEEEVDPEALGGKKQNPRKNKQSLSEAA
jgi:hypothetical protein